MLGRFKKIFPAVFIIISLLAIANPAYANWWENITSNKNLPVPPGAEEVKRDVRIIAGNNFDFIYYVSKSEIEATRDFYRNKLAATGWIEQEMMKDLKSIPGMKVDTQMLQVLSRNLSFSRGEEQLIISFLPQQYSQDKRVKFTVCHGKINKDIKESQLDKLPSLVAKPKKDVAPVYPEASLVLLNETDNSLRASYSTKSDIEDVTDYYRQKMPDYGWVLVEQGPLERKIAKGLPGVNPQDCPLCAKNTTAGNAEVELFMTQLKFTNQAGDSCAVVLSNAKGGPNGSSSGMSVTTILVDYAEKK